MFKVLSAVTAFALVAATSTTVVAAQKPTQPGTTSSQSQSKAECFKRAQIKGHSRGSVAACG